jgi:hypothetical protein
MRASLLTRWMLLPALLAAAPAWAQSSANDSGTFDVYVSGHRAGSEEFTIQQIGSGAHGSIVASGHVQLQLATGAVDLTPRLRTSGFDASPVSYEVIIGGTAPRHIIGTIGDRRVSSRTVTASGEQMREYLASSGAVVLDDGIAHQYYFLARRVRSGTVPVIIPSENRQVMATVTDRGEERVKIGDQTVRLYHIVVQPRGGDERDVWVDELARVIKVEIPAQDYVAVRTSIPA